jgi:hypothetical protein
MANNSHVTGMMKNNNEMEDAKVGVGRGSRDGGRT